MSPEQLVALLALMADLKSTVDRLAAENARLTATNADLVALIKGPPTTAE